MSTGMLLSTKPVRILAGLILAAYYVIGLSAGAFAASRDRDGDRMPDRWEINHGLNPDSANGKKDADKDGLKNVAEFRHGADPRDEDSDDDGSDDGDEVKVFDTDVDDEDDDNDGTLDGDEDSDGDGIEDEDEDDGDERCRKDDDDSDVDGVDDEDENEVSFDAVDEDSDDDGILDGNEDADEDGVDEEDEDDADDDACESEELGEDEDDAFATIVSYDSATGTLTFNNGTQDIVGTVTVETEIEWEDDDCSPAGEEEAGTADLQTGIQLSDVDFDDDSGTIEELELYCGR